MRAAKRFTKPIRIIDDRVSAVSGRGNISPKVRVHPVVFHRVLDLLHAEAWQVRQEDNSLRVLIVSPHASVNRAAVAERIRDALRVAGAAPIDVLVEDVLSISAGAGGKRPLVVAARH